MEHTKVNWSNLALLRFVLAGIVFSAHMKLVTGGHDWAEAISILDAKGAVIGFLLVSGFSIAASFDREQEGFYRRRFLRVYPLYFFAILFAFGLEVWTHNHIELPLRTFEGLGWTTMLGNLLMLQTFAVKPVQYAMPVWSLAIEVFYYAMTPIFARLPRRWLICIICISFVCYALPQHSDWGLAYLVASKFNALNYLWCWLLGFLLWSDRGLTVIILGSIGALQIFCGVITPERYAIVTYLGSFSALYFSHRFSLPPRLIPIANYLGDLSYPLYLYHLPLLILGYVVLGIHSSRLLLVLVLSLTIAVFHIVDRYLKTKFIAPLVYGLKLVGPKVA
jgi:peptidoglycan/LPS O-acetylase OafA/YrhL